MSMHNRVYKFTFEDGSEAFAHYGVKGMKWHQHVKNSTEQLGSAVDNFLINPLMSLLNPQQEEQQEEKQEEKKPEDKKDKAKTKFKKLTDKQREKIATAVVRGDYGNGAERVKKLRKSGYNAKDIQRRVNEMVWELPKGSLSKKKRS